MNKLKKEGGSREIIEKGIAIIQWELVVAYTGMQQRELRKFFAFWLYLKIEPTRFAGWMVCGEGESSINSKGFSLGSWKNGAAISEVRKVRWETNN